MKLPVFLDYNSTTPVDERVLEEMLPYFHQKYGNAASRTHAFGWEAEAAVDLARERIARLINAQPDEIIFTSGATEAINLSLKGTFETYNSSKGNHIITVSTEHKAVLDTCRNLESMGASITYLKVDREGLIDLDELKKSFTDKTILVSVMTANNETGVLQPIQQVAAIAHEHGAIMMSDATQACGKINMDVNDGIDLLCLSAHKIYGPKGVGALYVRRKNPRVHLAAQMHGGGHEKGLRSGTLNVPGIVGLGKACELAEKEMWEDATKISAMRTRLEQTLCDLQMAYINGSIRNRLPNTTNISFEGVDSNELIRELKDVAVATGSACTSALQEPSHVLSAMGLSKQLAHSSVRFSLGRFTTDEEINFAVECVTSAVKKLRG